MATYDVRCPDHGVQTVRVPMTDVRPTMPCPTCSAPARRLFGGAHLSFGDPTARRILDATERTATEPTVVHAPQGRTLRSTPRAPADPRLRKLPRP